MADRQRDTAGRPTMAILVGGGPAPGINGVIASATIEAINSGLRVIGLLDGYRWIARGDCSHVVELRIEDVSRIHLTGGSLLRTSRTNPAQDERSLSLAVEALDQLGVRYLLCIGGDDTTYAAAKIAERAGGRISVATVPKTIDNDLPLPQNAPTFGFETARSVGAAVVEALMEDARTTGRWYLVVTMGRRSGALALGIGKAAGTTLTVIPEEFREEKLPFSHIVDTIAGAIIKRKAFDRDYGVALVAEGVAERLDPASLDLHAIPALAGVERDAYGHPRLADIPLGQLLREKLRLTLKELGVEATVIHKDVGYELRCAKPVAFDIEYTRTLGYGAVRYLLSGGSGALIAIADGRVTPLRLEELLDKDTGRVRTRLVDVSTEAYQVARSYMIRLERRDFEEPMLSRLASMTKLSPEAFKQRFLPVVELTTPELPARQTYHPD